jgi:myo-inositol-1(or 4)-monophosphatase
MDLEKITLEVCELARGTGLYISEQAALISQSDIEEKGKKNLVTYVDRTAENMLVKGLGTILPGSEFIGEEFDYKREGKKPTWVIDPLDGTTNFIHGVPIFSISLALMLGEDVLSGVVYEISRKECFYAWQGSEAFLNGSKVRVSSIPDISGSLLVTGFPYLHEGKLERYLKIFKELTEKSHGLRRLGSAAVDMCYVAAGRMEGFYEYGLNPWDVAAGSLIVRQAGGKVTDFNGGDRYIHGREMLATNGHIHSELAEIIQRYFNKDEVFD